MSDTFTQYVLYSHTGPTWLCGRCYLVVKDRAAHEAAHLDIEGGGVV